LAFSNALCTAIGSLAGAQFDVVYGIAGIGLRTVAGAPRLSQYDGRRGSTEQHAKQEDPHARPEQVSCQTYEVKP